MAWEVGKLGPGKLGPGKLGPGKLGPGKLGPGKLGPGKLGPGKLGPGKLGPGKLGPGKLGPGKLGPGKLGPGKLGPGKLGPGKLGPGKLGPGKLGPGKLGPGKLGPGKLGPGKLGPGKLGPGKLGPGKLGPGKLGPGKLGPGKLGPGKLGPGKLGPGELICEYEKETQLPKQTKDHRPIAKSTDGLISEWRKKSELNPKPGDIIQYVEHKHTALYLGKAVAHIFGDKFKDYDVLIHLKGDRQGNMNIKLHDWAQESDDIKPRLYNILESKYESFSVLEMAKRAKKWVGCNVTKYSYKKYNCQHFVHLIKHGRLESVTESDLKHFYEESDPDNPKMNISKDGCTNEYPNYPLEIWSLTRKNPNRMGGVQHPKTIVSQNVKFLQQFYEFVPAKGKNAPILKVANYPHLVIHFMEAYSNTHGGALLREAAKVEELIKTSPASKESHIQALLNGMKSLWCAKAIKIAPPKTAGPLYLCGQHRTHFNIDALVLRDVVQIAKLALKDFLDVITPMIDGNHDQERLEEQRKTSDNPMLYMTVADWMIPNHLYAAYEGKRCVEEKILDKLWRSVRIKSAPPRPYEIKIVQFDSHEAK